MDQNSEPALQTFPIDVAWTGAPFSAGRRQMERTMYASAEYWRNLARAALMCTLLGAPLAAHAGGRACHKLDAKPKKQAACFETRATRLRETTRPMLPSEVDPKLRFLDAKNPLDIDRYYVGISNAPSGFADLDAVEVEIARLEGTMSLIQYSAQLARQGNVAEAGRIIQHVVPLLKKAKPRLAKLPVRVRRAASQIKDRAGENPLELIEVGFTVGRLVGRSKSILSRVDLVLDEGESLLRPSARPGRKPKS